MIAVSTCFPCSLLRYDCEALRTTAVNTMPEKRKRVATTTISCCLANRICHTNLTYLPNHGLRIVYRGKKTKGALCFSHLFFRTLTDRIRSLVLVFRCAQIHTDPMTGKETKKKRLGGAYPGQRRPQHQPYTPPEGAFAGGNAATAHFVAYGGGNALTLARPDGSAIPPASGGAQKEYIQGTDQNECYGQFTFLY